MGSCATFPGVLMITAATVLLVLVTCNTPLLKSFYFFRATFQDQEMKLGTLGYCITDGSGTNCVGPQIGYSLDLNKILNIKQNLFTIPASVSKWMTYTLVLHIVALAAGGLGVICGLLDMIPGFTMICFPTCLAGFCGGITMVALIFDLIMFYLFKASVNRVSGAHGEIGAALWMTLAAWLLASFAGCAYGLGRCCCNCGGSGGRRDRRRDRDYDRDRVELEAYRRDEDLRLDAIRDEHRRKQEQAQGGSGLPAFPEMERMPLNDKAHEDKYLYDDEGDHIPQVGAGYGRRDNANTASNLYQYDYNYGMSGGGGRGYEPSVTTAGAAGVGAGPAGVVGGDSYGGYNSYDNNYNGNYADPYQTPHDPYQSQPQSHNYDRYDNTQAYNNATSTYPPQQSHSPMAGAVAGAAAGAAAGAVATHTYNNTYSSHLPAPSNSTDPRYGTPSAESGYTSEPGPPVQQANTYQPYDRDDGLGAIGLAVTDQNKFPAQYPAGNTSTYPTGNTTYPSTDVSTESSYSANQQALQPPLQPTPQYLRGRNQSDLLTSPPAGHLSDPSQGDDSAPPSYGSAAPDGPGAYWPMEKGRPI